MSGDIEARIRLGETFICQQTDVWSSNHGKASTRCGYVVKFSTTGVLCCPTHGLIRTDDVAPHRSFDWGEPVA